jgi:transcriptional regulator with XRE-family HTH domain
MTEAIQAGRRAAGRAALARRGTLGLTQLKVAELAGVDVKTLRTLETGERWPIASNLAAIGAALGFQSGELQAIADSESVTVAP